MAKSSKKLDNRLKSMQRKTKKKRRVTASTPKRRKPTRRGLSDSGSLSKPTIMSSGKQTLSGGMGGGIYTLGSMFTPNVNPWIKAGIGLFLATGLAYFKAPFVGAGVAGATVNDLGKNILPNFLNDAFELEDAEYVDANTLSDSGFEDEYGNAVVLDDEGIMYALNDDGEYVAIGDSYDLQDAYELQDENYPLMVPASY